MKQEEKRYIYDLPRAELKAWFDAQDWPSYRYKQLEDWINKGVTEVHAMTNLPKNIVETLGEYFVFSILTCVEEHLSQIDATRKYVFRLEDGNTVECVYMEYNYGTSVCISSQAGCRMGCKFCASTKAGFARNLTSGEMLAQLSYVSKQVSKRISHLVVMGIGEPFENYDNLMMFLHELHRPESFGISYRNMTVSTCGLIPEMLNFSKEALPVTLAVSLHAADDALRQSLMPIAKRYPLKELISACLLYTKKTKRRISFEYAMFKEVNDSEEEAHKLCTLLRGMNCHVNLIPANPFPSSPFATSEMKTIYAFKEVLDKAHVPCSIRRSLGRDIMAACGQLRRRVEA